MNCKIVLYGFGSFPVVYRHLIQVARAQGSQVEFCAILTAPNYRRVMREVLPREDILDVYAELPRKPVGGDLSLLSGYRGSLVEDLAALKWERRKRTGRWRHAQGMEFYRLYRRFLRERKATHLLMSGIETPDAKIAVAVAQELDIGVIAPVDMRNLSGTYFSVDSHETPPVYAAATPETRTLAAEFIQGFRRQALPARNIPTDIAHGDDDQAVLEPYLAPFGERVKGFMQAALERPDLFDHEMIRVSVMRSFGPLRKTIRGLRRRRNERQYDIEHADMLPSRFIFYPLQYTPESSINVPAPYFVDQFRVVDALRFAMPSDCTLVVKEHPACLEMRPPAFMRRLRNLPGVMVAKATIPSVDMIRRAALTATVTGTAAIEAFLLGRPTMAFGPGLSAWALGGLPPHGDLRISVADALGKSMPDEFVVEQIAKLLSVRHPFIFGTAHMDGEPMLRRGNIRRFWLAILDHLARERRAKEPSAAAQP
jgi:hypothetical protein